MTLREIEDTRYELFNYVADKIKDIQSKSNELKNPEDMAKNKITLVKIKDFIDDIIRTYSNIEDLELEIPEEEDSSNDPYGAYSFL